MVQNIDVRQKPGQEPGQELGQEHVLIPVFRFLRKVFFGIAVVSMVINMLMLTGPIFMLQIYDRVLSSGSVPTLLVIGGLAFGLYVFFGLLEGLRSRLLLRTGQQVDVRLSGMVYALSTRLPLLLGAKSAMLRPVQDLDTVRKFLSGPGPGAIFDIPWIPLYLIIVFLFHPILGFTAVGGALIICVMIGINEVLSRKPAAQASKEAGRRSALVESGRRNAEVIRSMGMVVALKTRWEKGNSAYLRKQLVAGDRTGLFGTLIKTFRFLLQSAVLGVGGWLAIKQEITPGVMIAASIMTSRALAPVELAVGQWRGFVASRQSIKRLKKMLDDRERTDDLMDLPLPRKTLRLQNAFCGPAGSNKAFVRAIGFDLAAGDGLGIIGPSGCGKSTLVRAIVGVTPTLKGSIRFDGAKLDQWPPAKFGQFIGYLPQDIQLFDGTVAQNIARFDLDAPAEKIMDASALADVHDMIVHLPDGYNTMIGTEGIRLSGGQQQRIALARALYGRPFLIVLDEPNSNLDAEGEACLTRAIKTMRSSGSIVIVIAHRPSVTAAVNTILCMKAGQSVAYGPRDEVLKQVLGTPRRKRGAA